MATGHRLNVQFQSIYFTATVVPALARLPKFDEWFTSCLPSHNRRSLNQFLKQNMYADE